jgi:hypothetical protein
MGANTAIELLEGDYDALVAKASLCVKGMLQEYCDNIREQVESDFTLFTDCDFEARLILAEIGIKNPRDNPKDNQKLN